MNLLSISICPFAGLNRVPFSLLNSGWAPSGSVVAFYSAFISRKALWPFSLSLQRPQLPHRCVLTCGGAGLLRYPNLYTRWVVLNYECVACALSHWVMFKHGLCSLQGRLPQHHLISQYLEMFWRRPLARAVASHASHCLFFPLKAEPLARAVVSWAFNYLIDTGLRFSIMLLCFKCF